MIGDSINGRSQNDQMRFLLRDLSRVNTGYHVARPNNPPPDPMAFRAEVRSPAADAVQIGDWTLTQDPDSGDLIATNADGTTATVARKGGS